MSLNDGFYYFLEGAFYEFSFKNVVLHGVCCDTKVGGTTKYNFIFEVVGGNDVNLSSTKTITLQQIDDNNSFDKYKNDMYYAYITLEPFGAMGNSVNVKYQGIGVEFYKTNEKVVDGDKLRLTMKSTPFVAKPLENINVSDELKNARNAHIPKKLDLSWLNEQPEIIEKEIILQEKVKQPDGATLRQMLADLKHIIRITSILKKPVANAQKHIDSSITIKSKIDKINKYVSNAANSKFRLNSNTSQLLSRYDNVSGVQTPEISTPNRPSNSSSNTATGGKAKKEKEYKTYNKHRYIVRYGARGGKYIQVGDNKVYI
jgi:hypothetical protein